MIYVYLKDIFELTNLFCLPTTYILNK